MPTIEHEASARALKSPRITGAQRKRFFYLVLDEGGPQLSVARAAREVGISGSSGYKMMQGYRAAGKGGMDRAYGRDLPAPKPWAKLSDDAKYALDDFLLFREMFFARRLQLWAREASLQVLDAIASPERAFIDMNVFPGAGKTTVIHDLVLWLICGGGFMDPAVGRAMRIMLGSEIVRTATHMTLNVRRDLERRRPYWDKEQKIYAPKVLAVEFGRFRPDPQLGEEATWAKDQFLVAQIGELDIYEKEPTVQAASREAGFLGERVNLAVWDDLATSANSKGPQAQAELGRWFENEAEERLEPGGTLILVGQRLSAYDLHAHRLRATVTIDEEASEGETAETRPMYRHIIYPGHWDALCDGEHRQWNGNRPGDPLGDGCLTDTWRMPVKEWMARRSKVDYRTVIQQEDIDPGAVLVEMVWITGGEDSEGYPAPGCWDLDRGWGEHPRDTPPLIDYVSVDPSVSGWWALEWWATCPTTRFNYLIWGIRRKMTAGKLLDWDNREQTFTGHMQEMQTASVLGHHPIRCWVIEANAAHKYLFQFEHYRRWRQEWPGVAVIPHETGIRKLDEEYGVRGLLRGRYKTGMKRIPHLTNTAQRDNGFLSQLATELTTYSLDEDAKNIGFDTVMSDWIGETNLARIHALGKRDVGKPLVADARLPGYIQRRQHAVALTR